MWNSPALSLHMDTSDDPEATITHLSLYDSFLKLSIDLQILRAIYLHIY